MKRRTGLDEHNVLGRTAAGFLMLAAVIMLVVSCVAFPRGAYADECSAGGKHEYEVEVLAFAEESADGLRQFTCSKCGYQFQQAIPATGHDWGPWMTEIEPTCLHEGYEYRICARHEGHEHREERVLERLSPTGDHVYELVEQVEAACTEDGYSLFACAYCGASYRDMATAVGHTWGEWQITREPTVAEEGERQRVCLHDSRHVETEAVPKIEIKLEDEPEEIQGLPVREEIKPGVESEEVVVEKEVVETFNTVDRVLLAADLSAVGAFAVLMVPLLYKLSWTKRKRQEAIERVRKENQ